MGNGQRLFKRREEGPDGTQVQALLSSKAARRVSSSVAFKGPISIKQSSKHPSRKLTFICFVSNGNPDEESRRFAHFPVKRKKSKDT